MSRGCVSIASAGLLLLGWAHVASAHTRPPQVPVPPAPVEQTVGPEALLVAAAPAHDLTVAWLIGALVVALALAGRRSPRRAATLGLAVLLALLAFESGIHAVHHLDDPDAHCAVASASAHVPGAEIAPVDAGPILLVATDPLPVAEPCALPARFIRPDEGRAPPA